eukprot:COSAG04_NODE_932_length_9350_cov_665.689007_3_plen_79_part_00
MDVLSRFGCPRVANGIMLQMVVPGIIPTHLCDAIRDDVWKLLDADSEDRDSWYNRPTGSVMPSNPSGSYLAMWHTQAM